MKRIISATVILMGLAAPVWAGFDEGAAAYKRGDYSAALGEWRPLAEQGRAAAQYNLGVLYRKGQGVPRDYVEAAKWFRKAAAQGHAQAQSHLGHMYAFGRGVQRDYIQAYQWFDLAASLNPPGTSRDIAAQNQDTIAERMSATQIAKSERLAREWMAEFKINK